MLAATFILAQEQGQCSENPPCCQPRGAHILLLLGPEMVGSRLAEVLLLPHSHNPTPPPPNNLLDLGTDEVRGLLAGLDWSRFLPTVVHVHRCLPGDASLSPVQLW